MSEVSLKPRDMEQMQEKGLEWWEWRWVPITLHTTRLGSTLETELLLVLF